MCQLQRETVAPTGLLFELRSNPLGVESQHPRFCWQQPKAPYMGSQQAYQIQVATRYELLANGSPDAWDSGVVTMPGSLHVPYAGHGLTAGTRYYWWVRTWHDNRPSLFSQPARFVTGLWNSWQAKWIWSDQVCSNQHLFFRRELLTPDKPVQSVFAFVSADDYYKLYVNGRYVGQGPAPSYPRVEYNYNVLDLTCYWQPGKPFCLAAHAYYQGLQNYAWVSGDNLAGFILELRVEFTDGTKVHIGTDETWRLYECTAYQSDHLLGYKTGYNENLDLRAVPVGWADVNFDDHGWQSARLVVDTPWQLHAQETAMLQLYEMAPQRLLMKPDGSVFFDMGREIAGTLRLEMTGQAGQQIEVRLCEELDAPAEVRHKMRCNCNYLDTWTLRSGWQTGELYDYRGFRYGEVHNVSDPGRLAVTALVRHYPFQDDAAHFVCADPNLNALWDLAKYTTKVGTQEGYLDCPTREKGAYSLDTYLEMAAAFYQAGEWNLGRRAIEYLLQSSTNGKARCLAPAGADHFFTEYTMYPILMAWFYYIYTGDVAFLQRNYTDLACIESYIREHFRRSDGLLHDTNAELHDLVDWPENRRDGYEMLSVNTVVNAVYYRAVALMEHIASAVGDASGSAGYRRIADTVASSMNSLLWDDKMECYVDGMDNNGQCSRHASLHANAFPLAMGLVPLPRVSRVVEHVKTRGFNCNLFLAQFLFETLYDHGAAEHATAMLLGRGAESPLQMVRQGATTTWEAWDLDQKWNTSLFHPAGAFTGYIIGSRIMGITPLEPGFTVISIKPQVGGLLWGRIRVPTLLGSVGMSFRQMPGVWFRMEVSIPAGSRAQVCLPAHATDPVEFLVDGVETAYMIVDGFISIEVQAGHHVCEVFYNGRSE